MKTCAIVDAYGPGMFFPPLLIEQGYRVVHVQSTKAILTPFQDFIENAGYIANLVYDNNLDDITHSLRELNVCCIIPGFETGVIVADILSERLCLNSNGIKLSAARRSKSLMMDALKFNNVPIAHYIETDNIKIAIDWIKKTTQYPIVAKPIDSAGSEDVYICHNDNELETAYKEIINKVNSMGSRNSEILIQTYLEGTEYVVNSVSCEGNHYITDIWECKKRVIDNRIIYDKEELIPFNGEQQSRLVLYLYQVLDALGIRFGAAHSEIMLTKNGPILLETGARIGGGVNHFIHKECFGHSQIELCIDAYMNPTKFYEKTSKPYEITNYLYIVEAISQKEGIIQNITLIDDIKRLSSFRHIRLKKKVGDRLQKTIDLQTSPAVIYLASQNRALLEEEYQTLLSLIDDGFEVDYL